MRVMEGEEGVMGGASCEERHTLCEVQPMGIHFNTVVLKRYYLLVPLHSLDFLTRIKTF